MLNIPSDITLKKSKKLTQQNMERDLKDGKIDPKFSYTTKRGIKNLVIEIDSNNRKNYYKTGSKWDGSSAR